MTKVSWINFIRFQIRMGFFLISCIYYDYFSCTKFWLFWFFTINIETIYKYILINNSAIADMLLVGKVGIYVCQICNICQGNNICWIFCFAFSIPMGELNGPKNIISSRIISLSLSLPLSLYLNSRCLFDQNLKSFVSISIDI